MPSEAWGVFADRLELAAEYDAAVVSAFTKLADLLPQPIARHVAATMLSVGEHGRGVRHERHHLLHLLGAVPAGA